MRSTRKELIETIQEEFGDSVSDDGVFVDIDDAGDVSSQLVRVEISTAMGMPIMYCDIFQHADPRTAARVLRATVDAIVGRDGS